MGWARKIGWAGVANGAGLALFALLYLWAQPPGAVLLAAGLAPPVAAILAARGVLTLGRPTDAGPSEIAPLLWLGPCFGLAYRAQADLASPAWGSMLLVALALGAGAALLAWRADRGMPPGTVASAAVVLSAGIWGGLALANQRLDPDPPTFTAAEIIDRRLGPSRQTPWLTLRTRQTPPRLFADMWVSQDVYDAAAVGGQVCLDAQDGALGWPYARVTPCALAPAPPAP
ncbi:hypothetical protein [Phenylobacterium sp.]|uniref:hypothetical protein n=1 Tax=Phenylobacterium sp. TaxID=1871053 RepID=UPI003BAAFB2C